MYDGRMLLWALSPNGREHEYETIELRTTTHPVVLQY
jgi:hypothetical protein